MAAAATQDVRCASLLCSFGYVSEQQAASRCSFPVEAPSLPVRGPPPPVVIAAPIVAVPTAIPVAHLVLGRTEISLKTKKNNTVIGVYCATD